MNDYIESFIIAAADQAVNRFDRLTLTQRWAVKYFLVSLL
jgi:hypothetical protein